MEMVARYNSGETNPPLRRMVVEGKMRGQLAETVFVLGTEIKVMYLNREFDGDVRMRALMP